MRIDRFHDVRGGNLDGAVGIAMPQTLSTKREQFHSNVLMQSVSTPERATRTRIEQLTDCFMNLGVADPAAASHQAVAAICRIVRKQAHAMPCSDAFFLPGAVLIVALAVSLLLRNPVHFDAGGAY